MRRTRKAVLRKRQKRNFMPADCESIGAEEQEEQPVYGPDQESK
jgi:hypothetical protein